MDRGIKRGKEGLSTDVERFWSGNHFQKSVNIMLKLGLSGG
jgi:hypothetical protein